MIKIMDKTQFIDSDTQRKIDAPLNGTLISGTHRMCDLIPVMLAAIRDTAEYVQLHDRLPSVVTDPVASEWDDRWNDADVIYLYEELTDIMERYAPEGYYFGTHPGDGSDFGYWRDDSYMLKVISESVKEDHPFILDKDQQLIHINTFTTNTEPINAQQIAKINGEVMVGNKMHMVSINRLEEDSVLKLFNAVKATINSNISKRIFSELSEEQWKKMKAVGYPYATGQARGDGLPTIPESIYWRVAAGIFSLDDATRVFSTTGFTNGEDPTRAREILMMFNKTYGKLSSDFQPLPSISQDQNGSKQLSPNNNYVNKPHSARIDFCKQIFDKYYQSSDEYVDDLYGRDDVIRHSPNIWIAGMNKFMNREEKEQFFSFVEKDETLLPYRRDIILSAKDAYLEQKPLSEIQKAEQQAVRRANVQQAMKDLNITPADIIQQLFDDFVKQHGEEPLYADVNIQFKKEEFPELAEIKLSKDVDDRDDKYIFFNVDGIEGLKQLTNPDNGEDFYIVDVQDISFHPKKLFINQEESKIEMALVPDPQEHENLRQKISSLCSAYGAEHGEGTPIDCTVGSTDLIIGEDESQGLSDAEKPHVTSVFQDQEGILWITIGDYKDPLELDNLSTSDLKTILEWIEKEYNYKALGKSEHDIITVSEDEEKVTVSENGQNQEYTRVHGWTHDDPALIYNNTEIDVFFYDNKTNTVENIDNEAGIDAYQNRDGFFLVRSEEYKEAYRQSEQHDIDSTSEDIHSYANDLGIEHYPIGLKEEISVDLFNIDVNDDGKPKTLKFASVEKNCIQVYDSIKDIFEPYGGYNLEDFPTDIQLEVVKRLCNYLEADNDKLTLVYNKAEVPTDALPNVLNGNYFRDEYPGCKFILDDSSRGYSCNPAFREQPTATVYILKDITPNELMEEKKLQELSEAKTTLKNLIREARTNLGEDFDFPEVELVSPHNERERLKICLYCDNEFLDDYGRGGKAEDFINNLTSAGDVKSLISAIQEGYENRLKNMAKHAIILRIVQPTARSFTPAQVEVLNRYRQVTAQDKPAGEVFKDLLQEVSQEPDVARKPEKWVADTAKELNDLAEGITRDQSRGMNIK